jgi:hypothetical protein
MVAVSDIIDALSSPSREETMPVPSAVDVFDGARNIPDNLQVNDALNTMVAEKSAVIPNDLENRIDASARSSASNSAVLNDPRDDMDLDDLKALAAALPGTKIDFKNELEADSDTSKISPMAKELLGDFDIDTLQTKSINPISPVPTASEEKETEEQEVEEQVLEEQVVADQETSDISESISPEVQELPDGNRTSDTPKKKPLKISIPVQDTDTREEAEDSQNTPVPSDSAEPMETVAAEVALDVQEDESGTVQVSSPFMFNVVPQLADFAVPQTIFSTFSNDWIQESGSMSDSVENDVAKFCYTEESRPMFVRKKKTN